MRTWWLFLAAGLLLLSPAALAQQPKPAEPTAPLLKPTPVQLPNLQLVRAPDKNSLPAEKAGGPAPRIVCDAPQYDFGSVAEGEEVKHVFSVRNAGKGVLKIIQARGG